MSRTFTDSPSINGTYRRNLTSGLVTRTMERIRQLLYIVVGMLIVLRIESYDVDITYLESAVAKGAVCLDGSPPAYHFSAGFGAGINSWLIQLEGGAWCNNATTCLARRNTQLGSSTKMVKTFSFSGIFSNKAKFNPDFFNWNKIRVRYCDGASFTGDVEAVDPVTKLYYRGARIFLAVMDDLFEKGMANAENAVLSGCSAGGLAAIHHCDRFKGLFPASTKVKCFSDAGFFINAKTIIGTDHIKNFYNDVVATHESAKNLPSSCTSRMSPGLCFFPQNAAQGITTPLFIMNAAYDSWQIKNILAPGVADRRGLWRDCKLDILKCSDAQIEIMHGFRTEFLNALASLGPSSSRGHYINSCYSHCQTGTQETWLRNDSPRLNNKTISQAMGDWFHDRSPFQEIDCPYPCDKTCHNRVFDSDELPSE